MQRYRYLWKSVKSVRNKKQWERHIDFTDLHRLLRARSILMQRYCYLWKSVKSVRNKKSLTDFHTEAVRLLIFYKSFFENFCADQRNGRIIHKSNKITEATMPPAAPKKSLKAAPE